ncbi:MAG: DUF4352 domain-containing protein [Candidatus Natronoplasma sp.]
MDKKKMLALLLTSLVIISAFTALAGCLTKDEPSQEVELDVKRAYVKEVDADDEPSEEGREFLWLKVEMTNLRDENLEIDHVLFEAESKEEVTYTAHQGVDINARLEPDETNVFWLIFDIPEDFTADELLFIPYDERGPVGWTSIPSY